MTIADLHFLRPLWWLAALPLPLMLFAMLRNQHGRAALARLADANLLPHLVRGGGRRRFLALALAAASASAQRARLPPSRIRYGSRLASARRDNAARPPWLRLQAAGPRGVRPRCDRIG